MDKLQRLSYLTGQEALDKLKTKKVLLCGTGGVGSFVAEALARSGIGTIIAVDYDIVDITNLNRQLLSDKCNIGMKKVEALKRHIEAISDTKVECRDYFIDEDFEIPDVDYVIDCIDTLSSKFVLAKKSEAKGIPFIASMGTARRLEIGRVIYTTLDKTKGDPLARRYRNLVKKEAYKHKIEVVYCDSEVVENKLTSTDGKFPLGSAIFTVGSVGLKIANIVFLNLIKGA